MHELSIAIGIIEAVTEERCLRQGTMQAVQAVHLRLGPLSGVDRSALEFAYQVAREQTRLARADLVIEETPVTFHCPACNCTRSPVSIQCLVCSVCGMPATEITGGNELEIVALEIIENEPASAC